MATKKRQSDPSVAWCLKEEYYSFSFFKAVELLETLSAEKKRLGQALVPGEEAVRFSVPAQLNFPASDISGLELATADQPASMEVTFLGLIGPSGALPYWFTELAQQRLYKKDKTLKAFYDIFHHRLLSLFYLAWKKHKFTVNYRSGAKDRLSQHLLSLTGLGTAGLSKRIGIPEESLTFYSGHLSRNAASSTAIQAAVEHFSGVKANVCQFVGRVLPLEREDLSQLGGANGQLGVTTVVGSQVWECQTKFRVELGPLTFREFKRFLPDDKKLQPIFALVKYMVGIEFEFDVRLILKKQEIQPCVLGKTGPDAPQLGWTTWLQSPGFDNPQNPYLTFAEKDLATAEAVH